MHVIDLDGIEYPLQATLTNDYELNGNQELSATIEPNQVNNAFIDRLSEMWIISDHDDVKHKIIYSKKQGTGDRLKMNIRAIPLFFDTFGAQRIYDRFDQHMTAFSYFSIVFADSGYNFILVDSFEAIQWQGAGEDATRLEMFKNGLNRYGAEFRISGNTIYIEEMIGIDSQFRYEYKLNASNIVLESDSSEFYTYARGYGDYGDGEGGEGWQDANLIREYTSPLANIPNIGIRHAPPIKNGNITLKETMDSNLKKLVEESRKISATADIQDLTKQNYPIAQSNLGDRVYLTDSRIGFDEKIRISNKKLTRDWRGHIVALDLTFGVPGLVKRHQSNINNGIKRINDILEGRQPLPYNVLPEAIKRASEALLGAMTELEISELGIIARDVDNPNNLVLYNSSGLGVSRDGGQTFENAITYLGVNTNLLTAGDIHTNNIRIIGRNNYFFWDGNALTAIDPNNPNKRLDIMAGLLDIKEGAIRIQGKDGRMFVQDGVPNLNYNVQGSSPPFTSALVRVANQWYITENTSDQNVDMFSFRHEGRYLKVTVAHRMETEGTSSGAVTIRGLADWSNIINSYTVFSNSVEDGSEYHTFTIDIGIPTYRSVNFYVQLRTGAANRRAMTRVLRCWQEG